MNKTVESLKQNFDKKINMLKQDFESNIQRLTGREGQNIVRYSQDNHQQSPQKAFNAQVDEMLNQFSSSSQRKQP